MAKRVLTNIDEGQSTVVSAPTSVGKQCFQPIYVRKKHQRYFLSSPQPLAIQVASMFSVLKDANHTTFSEASDLSYPVKCFHQINSQTKLT